METIKTTRRNGHIDSCEWYWGDKPKEHSEECIRWQDTEVEEIEIKNDRNKE